MKSNFTSNLFFIFLLIIVCLFNISCLSTQVKKNEAENIAIENVITDDKKTVQEDDGPVQIIEKTETIEEHVQELSASQKYIEKVQLYTLIPLTTPAPTTNGKAFKKDFSICVLSADTNEPVKDIQITVSYPDSRDSSGYQFKETVILTDKDGIVNFTSPIPNFSTNTNVLFYITPDSNTADDSQIQELNNLISQYSLKIPYQVKTNMNTKPGSISLLDYDKRGKPITNNSVSSSALLTSLIRLGFSKIGNSDFSEQIASGKTELLYKQAENLFGSDITYLIYGTIKYDGDVIKSDAGYTVNLIADITVYDMLNKVVLYSIVLPVSSTEKTEWDALNNARVKQLGPKLAEQLYYGI